MFLHSGPTPRGLDSDDLVSAASPACSSAGLNRSNLESRCILSTYHSTHQHPARGMPKMIFRLKVVLINAAGKVSSSSGLHKGALVHQQG